jgi:hypothetical protein
MRRHENDAKKKVRCHHRCRHHGIDRGVLPETQGHSVVTVMKRAGGRGRRDSIHPQGRFLAECGPEHDSRNVAENRPTRPRRRAASRRLDSDPQAEARYVVRYRRPDRDAVVAIGNLHVGIVERKAKFALCANRSCRAAAMARRKHRGICHAPVEPGIS